MIIRVALNLLIIFILPFTFFGVSCGTGGSSEPSTSETSPGCNTTTVPPGTPTIYLHPPESITNTSAILVADVNPNGESSEAAFAWGTDPDFNTYDNSPVFLAGGDNASHRLTYTVTGLTPGVEYYARVGAENINGTRVSSVVGFVTSGPPKVSTSGATDVQYTMAMLNGVVNPSGYDTDAWFEWGSDPDLGSFNQTTVQSLIGDKTERQINEQLTGVIPDFDYYFRAAASNSEGTRKGVILKFSTPKVLPTEVIGVTPVDSATNESIYTHVRVYFRADMDPSTITTKTFQIRSGGNAVAGSISYLNREAIFTPSTDLIFSNTYSAELTTGVRNLSGNPLSYPYTWQFTTHVQPMGFPVPLVKSAYEIRDPVISLDSNGNALAVWLQSDGRAAHYDYNVWSSYFEAGSGWGTPELLYTNEGYAVDLKIEGDSSGNHIAIWKQQDPFGMGGGDIYRIWTSRYVPGSGWDTPERIDQDDTYEDSLDLDVAADGSAIAVWCHNGITHTDIWASHYKAGSGWSPRQPVSQFDGNGNYPIIAIDTSGNALAVWAAAELEDLNYRNLWASYYSPASGWSTPGIIEDQQENVSYYAKAEFDGSGIATVVWTAYLDGTNSTWVNNYSAASGLGIPENIADTIATQLVVNDAGDAFVSGDNFIRHYSKSTGWDAVTQISKKYSAIDIDSFGNGYLVYGTDNNVSQIWSTVKIWAHFYTRADGWSNKVLIGAGEYKPYDTNLIIGLDSNQSGNVMAAWVMWHEGQYALWVNSLQ